MRVLALAVFALIVAADQSASAASCGKGMMWPYVRNPGDCLTDAEVSAGMRGVYNGPVITNPDIGSMQQGVAPAPAPVQQPAPVDANGAPLPAVAPVPAGLATPASAPAPVANYDYRAPAAGADCTKGALWPFIKKPGDCQTGVEKKRPTGVCYYRNPGDCQIVEEKRAGVVTKVGSVGPIAAAQVSASGAPVRTAGPAGPVAQPPVNQVPTCTKGVLWPFVKKPGDCPSTGERNRGK